MSTVTIAQTVGSTVRHERALSLIAHGNNLPPYTLKIGLVLLEHGGAVKSDVLAELCGYQVTDTKNESAIRRAICDLISRSWVEPRRRGVRMPVTLTHAGQIELRWLADRVEKARDEIDDRADAA